MASKEIITLVNNTQNRWADLILKIGKEYKKNSNLQNLVDELLHEIYSFNHCDVLFKPTMAVSQQFRSSKNEFISYFLGQNNVCKEDKGFAIKNWKSIKFENYKIVDLDKYVISMGNYFFEDENNKSLKVEFTFGFIKINNNELKINLHHSSLPYNE